MTREIDADRLVRDLRAAAEECVGPDPALGRASHYELVGMARAWMIAAASIESGDYDLEPPFDIEAATARLRAMREEFHRLKRGRP
jgi:hypothetical protein